jgi:hypothetical protein
MHRQLERVFATAPGHGAAALPQYSRTFLGFKRFRLNLYHIAPLHVVYSWILSVSFTLL